MRFLELLVISHELNFVFHPICNLIGLKKQNNLLIQLNNLISGSLHAIPSNKIRIFLAKNLLIRFIKNPCSNHNI